MGKSFKGFSKAISLFLAVAMVVTMLPTSAYAADIIADDSAEILSIDEDTIVEEASSAKVSNDATALSDDDSSIDTQEASDKEVEDLVGNTAGEEDINPDKYSADVIVKFVIADNHGGANKVKILKTTQLNEGTDPLVDLTDEITDAGDKPWTTGLNAYADSDNGYSFVVAPDLTTGQELKAVFIDADTTDTFYNDYTALKYDSGWKKKVENSWTAANAADMATPVEKVAASTGLGCTVEDYALVPGYKKVTLTSALLKDVIAKYQDMNEIWAAAESSTDAATQKAKLAIRPVITITLEESQAGSFVFEQPTTKGTTEMLNSVAESDRTLAWAAISADGTGGKAIKNISLKTDYVEDNDFDDAKITMTIVDKDGKNVDGIKGLSAEAGKAALAVFPFTAKGSAVIGAGKGALDLKGDKTDGTHIKAVPFVFDTTTGSLFVSQYIINEAYAKGYKVYTSFDFTEDVYDAHTVTVANMKSDGYVYAKDNTTKLAKVEKKSGTAFVSSVKENEDVEILFTGEAETSGKKRQITGVSYTVGTSTTKKKIDGSAVDAWTVKIPMSEIKADMTFYVETNEVVTLDVDDTLFSVYDKNGKKVVSGETRTASDEPFEFSIHAKKGQMVDTVSYSLGGHTQDENLNDDENGIYKTVAVTDGLKITVTGSEEVQKYYASRNTSAANLSAVPTITSAETAAQVLAGETKIHSAFWGTEDEFIDYWNGLYGETRTNIQGVLDGGTRQVFAYTIEFGSDKPANMSHYGVKAVNGATTSWTLNSPKGDLRVAREGNDSKNCVTLFHWGSTLTGIFGDVDGKTIDIQPFAVLETEVPKASALSDSDAETYGKTHLLGSVCGFKYAGTGATSDVDCVPSGNDGRDVLVLGQPYYFEATLAENKMITGVKYTMNGEEYDAEFVSGDKYGATAGAKSIWKTVPVMGDVCIDVQTSSFRLAKVDGLSKSKVTTANGTVVTKDGIAIDATKDFKFTITSNDADSIKITEVVYNDGTSNHTLFEASSTKPAIAAGTYTITAPIADNITIKAKTEETIDPAKYSVEFKNKKADKAESEKGTEAGEQLTNTYDAKNRLTSQKLTLSINEESRLTAATYGGVVVRDAKYDPITFGAPTYKAKVNKVKDSVKVVVAGTGAAIDSDGYVTKNATVGEIKGYAVGSDELTVEVRDASAVYTSNTELYTGTLPVEVVNQFSDLYIDSDSEAIEDGKGTGATLSIKGIDGRTNKPVDVVANVANDGVGKIAWSFVPDISTKVSPDYGFTAGLNPVVNDTTSTSNVNNSVIVMAKDGAESKITVQAKVYDEATPANVVATLTKELTIVEKASYTLIPTVTISGGKTYQGANAIKSGDTIGSAKNGTALLELENVASGQNTATVSYKVYKQLKKNADLTKPALTVNSDAKAIVESLAAGDYEEVTSGITYKSELKNGKVTKVDGNYVWAEDKDDTAIYATLTGTASPFTVTAAKKTGYTSNDVFAAERVAITPLVNGIAQATQVYGFRVVDRIEKADVQFNLNGVAYAADGKYIKADEEDKTTDTANSGKVVVRTLSDAYLNGYTNTKSVVYAFSEKYTTGVILKDVVAGTKITLPKEDKTSSDFTTTNKDPRAVLVGWKAAGGTVYDADSLLATTVFAPGADVIVGSTNVEFTAVWAPKYALYTLTGVTDSTAVAGGKYWDAAAKTAGTAETFALGNIVNGDKAQTNKYMDPTDAAYDGTKETSSYSIYKTPITNASIDVDLNTALFAFTPYKLAVIDNSQKILYRPVVITSGYTLGYDEDADSTDKLNITGTKISGKAVGSASQLVATLTEDGTTWEFRGTNANESSDKDKIVVGNASVYKVAFNNGKSGNDATKVSTTTTSAGYHSIENPLATLTLQVSQKATTVTPAILKDKDTSFTGNSTGTYKYDYKLASGGDSVVSISAGANGYDEVITPKAVGTTTLTLTVTDNTGVSATTTLAIEVVEDQVVFDITNAKGEAFDGKALGGAADGIVFYAAAYAKADTAKATKLDGTWVGTTPAATNKVAAATAGTVLPANDNTDRQKATFSSALKELDTDNVAIEFTYGSGDNAITYTKNVEVTTHYEVVFNGGTGTKGAPSKTFITKDGERVLDEEATALAEEDIPAATATLEITTADKTVKDKVTTYNVDLSKFGIEELSKNTDGTYSVAAKKLDFWYYDGKTGSEGYVSEGADDDASELYNGKDVAFTKSEIKNLKSAIYSTDSTPVAQRGIAKTGSTASDGNGKLQLQAKSVTSPISKATPTLSTVTLENATGKEFKEVEVNILPAGSNALITIAPDDHGFFEFSNNGKTGLSGYVASPESYKWASAEYATFTNKVRANNATDTATINFADTTNAPKPNVAKGSGTNTRTDKFAVGMITLGGKPKAGKTTLHIYAADDTEKKIELSTVELIVNGLNYDTNTDVTNYIENGEIVKSDKRTVGTDTYVFDEEGKQVTGSKVVKLADGTDVLVLDGKLAKAGVRGLGMDNYLVNADGVILSGWQDYENNTYYADPENGNKLVDGLQTIGGKKYAFKSNALLKSKDAKDYASVTLADGTVYYTNKDGEVAAGGIFKVDEKNRLFREDGTIVVHTDSDVVNGKITVGNITYVIDPATDEATEDDRLGFVKTIWGDKPKAETIPAGGVPTITAKAKYTSQKGKDYGDNFEKSVNVTVVKNTEKSTDKKAVFTATADLSNFFDSKYETKMTTESKDFVYGIDKDGNLTDKTEAESGTTPGEPEQPDNKKAVNLFYTKVNKEIVTVKVPEGAKVSEASTGKTKYYEVKDNGDGTITVSVTAATVKDLKAAAKASNSTVTIPVYTTVEVEGSESKEEISGQFTYSLPVFYQKPTLKLTAKNGTINTKKTGESGVVPQTLKTTVTEKKSTGIFEPIDLTDGENSVTYSGTAELELSDENVGEVLLTASAKTKGKIKVQLEDWVEASELSFEIKQATKNIFTTDKKQVYFNTNALAIDGATPESQTITILMNGVEITPEDNVKLDKLPKGWAESGLKIADGCLSDDNVLQGSSLTFEYSGTTPPAKNKSYSFKFKAADNANITVKATMSKNSLDNKAVVLKVKTKMNLTTKQKMVLLPQFKGLTGTIDNVTIDDASAKLFATDDLYNEELGQFYLAPADGVTLSSKTKYTVKFSMTVGGVPCSANVSFKPSATSVTVKVDTVKLPKSKIIAGTATGEANIYAKFKIGSKYFSIAPNDQKSVDPEGNEIVTTKAVTFMIDSKTPATALTDEQKSELNLEGDWYAVPKANAYVRYNTEDGTISVRSIANTKGKGGTVKVWLNFNGKTIKKNLSVKVDSKK